MLIEQKGIFIQFNFNEENFQSQFTNMYIDVIDNVRNVKIEQGNEISMVIVKNHAKVLEYIKEVGTIKVEREIPTFMLDGHEAMDYIEHETSMSEETRTQLEEDEYSNAFIFIE